jgi:two-component sensor histidine kinase
MALARGERVIIPDVAQDPAYAPSLAAARVAGYRAVQSTPLLTATGGPLGMLSTHFRQPRRFAARELRLTDLYARLASEALAAQLLAQSLRERAVHEHAARVELRDALAEQRALLHEVNHRVKNNLEVINSLLSLQAADVQDVRAQQALAEAANRVRALGLVHRLLYEAPRIAQLDLGRFAEELAQALFASYGVAHDRVRFELSGERLGTDLQHAVPLGLIFNELFCNVLKHAFPGGRPGCIQLRIDAAGVLYLADDGIGLPTSVDVGHPRSLGLRLVQALVRQVGGTLQVVPGPGTRYRLQLPPAQEGGSSLSRRSRAS